MLIKLRLGKSRAETLLVVSVHGTTPQMTFAVPNTKMSKKLSHVGQPVTDASDLVSLHSVKR